MKKCKFCNKEIDFLCYGIKVSETGKLYADEFIAENSERLNDSKYDEFNCPECNAVLFTNQDEAQEWLKNICGICHRFEDEDGRCGCTNKDSK